MNAPSQTRRRAYVSAVARGCVHYLPLNFPHYAYARTHPSHAPDKKWDIAIAFSVKPELKCMSKKASTRAVLLDPETPAMFKFS